jgi:hypothetical protein
MRIYIHKFPPTKAASDEGVGLITGINTVKKSIAGEVPYDNRNLDTVRSGNWGNLYKFRPPDPLWADRR